MITGAPRSSAGERILAVGDIAGIDAAEPVRLEMPHEIASAGAGLGKATNSPKSGGVAPPLPVASRRSRVGFARSGCSAYSFGRLAEPGRPVLLLAREGAELLAGLLDRRAQRARAEAEVLDSATGDPGQDLDPRIRHPLALHEAALVSAKRRGKRANRVIARLLPQPGQEAGPLAGAFATDSVSRFGPRRSGTLNVDSTAPGFGTVDALPLLSQVSELGQAWLCSAALPFLLRLCSAVLPSSSAFQVCRQHGSSSWDVLLAKSRIEEAGRDPPPRASGFQIAAAIAESASW